MSSSAYHKRRKHNRSRTEAEVLERLSFLLVATNLYVGSHNRPPSIYVGLDVFKSPHYNRTYNNIRWCVWRILRDEGYTFAEIAAPSNRSPATVQRRLAQPMPKNYFHYFHFLKKEYKEHVLR